MKHTISILVENHAGVLARVAGLFARRGFNIDSLAVGVTEDERFPVLQLSQTERHIPWSRLKNSSTS